MSLMEVTSGVFERGGEHWVLQAEEWLNPFLLFMSPSALTLLSLPFLGVKPRQRRMAGPQVLSHVFFAVPQ